MSNPKRLIQKAYAHNRRIAFKALSQTIQRRQPLTPSERHQLKSIILTKTILGELTAKQAKSLTMALGPRGKP
jgi:hypothetical protein